MQVQDESAVSLVAICSKCEKPLSFLYNDTMETILVALKNCMPQHQWTENQNLIHDGKIYASERNLDLQKTNRETLS